MENTIHINILLISFSVVGIIILVMVTINTHIYTNVINMIKITKSNPRVRLFHEHTYHGSYGVSHVKRCVVTNIKKYLVKQLCNGECPLLSTTNVYSGRFW